MTHSPQNNHAAATLERRAKQLLILNRIGQRITSVLDQQNLLQEAVDALRNELGYLRAAVLLRVTCQGEQENGDKNALYVVAATDNFWDVIPDDYVQEIGEGAIGTAAETEETVVIHNAASSPIPYRIGDWFSSSSVSAPIIIGGKLEGVLEVEDDKLNAFDEDDVMVINALAAQIAVAIQNARLHEQAYREIEDRKHIEQELRESETKYKAIIEQSHDAIYIYRENHFLFVNNRVSELTGYSKEELYTFDVWSLLHPDDRERIRAIGEKRVREEQVSNTYIARVLCKDGKSLVCDFSVNAITYQGEYAVLGVVRDITEREEIEKQLHRQGQLAAVGQLAGGIAHDFRNFLTTIILQAQIAQRTPNVSPDVTLSLESILSEAQQASKLIQQILDFSRHSMMKTSLVDFPKFIGESAFMIRQAIREDIQYTMAMETEECIVEIDPARIQQMLVNLASNARDAMPDGGKFHIALEKITFDKTQKRPLAEMSPGEWAHLSVSDTGIGMDEDVLAHIFEPFFTTKEVGKGTGLGLAQVYGIVKQHEGFIDVESLPGEWTTFHIYFPVSQAKWQQKLSKESTIPKGKGETILLVEDNEQLRQAGKMVIEGLGYSVHTATNGREALEIYHSQPTDLVLTDLVMPVMGGQELRSNLEKAGHVKILAMTGYIMETNKEKLIKSGFLDVIAKPFNIDELARVIRETLDKNS